MTTVEMYINPEHDRVTVAQAEQTGQWITADKSLLVAVEQ